jgi:D-alanine--poly(phosphoribitol) ligase subunit 1
LIEEQAITHVLTVPSFVSYLKPLFSKIKLPSVTNWLFCGEALRAEMVSAWQKCIPNADIYNVYGPTEATIFCTSYHCPKNSLKHYHGIVSIGKPFNDTVFGLFDGNLPANDLDTASELYISGSQLTQGYLDDPEKNKMAFFNYNDMVYYRSGDLCIRDKQGYYFFTGRNDTQVKINGYRVEINELEYYAGDFPDIIECVVIVTTNEKSAQQQLNLAYTAKYEIVKEEIISFLATKIPSYMLPANIYSVESIPLNLNGKIDKRALADQISRLK